MSDNVLTFSLVPLEVGQKIRLLEGPRRGDWLVIEVGERQMRVRCPVSGKELTWDRLTLYSGTLINEEWPLRGERKRAPEYALTDPLFPEADQRYRMLVEQSPLAIAIHQEGKLVFVNPATLELLGAKSDADLLGKAMLNFVHPDDRPKVLERLNTMRRGEPVPLSEERFLRLDGTMFNAAAVAGPVTYLGKPAFMVIVSDISQQRRLEEALSRAQGIAHLGSWSYDPVTQESQFSPEFYRIFGVTPGEFDVSRGDLVEAVHPLDRELMRTKLAKSLKEKTPYVLEHRIRRPDGAVRHLSVRGEWSEDPHTGHQVFLGTALDVTEKTVLEAELRQAQKMEALGTLAGGVAHDFNNILSAVLGYAELSYGMARDSSPQQKYLGEVLKAGRRARDLVKQILAFSRKSDAPTASVDVGRLVDETLGMLRATIPTSIPIIWECPQKAIHTWGSATQLSQVVTNLVTNAYQASKVEGGQISVEVKEERVAEKRQLTVGELNEGDYAVLVVADRGPGIPEEDLEKIFDPFFTTKTVGEGTGLGLSVVHGIVSSMGGAIAVESHPGHGARFTVYLPLSDTLSEAGQPASGPLPAEVKALNILVVDDEAPLAELGKVILETLGHTASAASSPAEALRLFGEGAGKFDLLITDQTMPSMTGIQLLRKLKTIDPGLRAILCTGYSDAVNESTLAETGAGFLLMKPFSRENLKNAIRVVMSDEKDTTSGPNNKGGS